MTKPNCTAVCEPKLLSSGLIAVLMGVMACSAYANFAYIMTDPGDYDYFPPFRAGYNRNNVDHLGGENLSIARAINAGHGFADPFDRVTGPTAWMPPVFPYLLASLLAVFDGDRSAVKDVIVIFHLGALVWSGAFVLYGWKKANPQRCVWLPICVLGLCLMADFRYAFQFTHDHFLVLYVLNGLVLWSAWGHPLASTKRAIGWGLLGGSAALVTPALGLTWAGLTCLMWRRGGTTWKMTVAIFVAALIMTPWTVRNYVTFGRFIPVKSNLNFELYQSQCMQPDGVLQASSVQEHPRQGNNEQAAMYDRLGESEFLAQNGEEFWAAVEADPWEFARRVRQRFVAAALWYVPRDRSGRSEFVAGVWLARVLHPLPWVAVIVFATVRRRERTNGEGSVVVALLIYIIPYILVSYNERYYFPLLGIRAFLIASIIERATNLLVPQRIQERLLRFSGPRLTLIAQSGACPPSENTCRLNG
ncbi:MAG TPA: hypothetical protein VHR66_02845 [Gemmataceae bacterium]|jgi:hypothetical protein|nr:hypothetical protein [Gemmataceae bacterium]